MKIFVLLFIIILAAFSGFYTKDMGQKNPESLFLTDLGLAQYLDYLEVTPEKDMLILVKKYDKKINNDDIKKFNKESARLKKLCGHSCDVITYNEISSSQIFQLKSEKQLALVIVENEKKESVKELLNYMKSDSFFSPHNKSVSLAGLPYTNYLLDQYSYSIKEKLFPFMFLMTFLLILILTRNLRNSIIIFLPALFSATLSLLFIRVIFHNMNMVTSIVPLMAFVINLSLSFHLFYSRREDKPMIETLKYKRQPILLMIITTSIGFGSLCISEIEVIKNFGLLCSLLIILTSFQTILWFICLGDRLVFKKSKFFINLKHFEKTFNLKTIVVVSVISVLIGGYSINKISFITDATEYFPEETNIKKSINDISENVVGLPIFNFVTRGHEIKINDYEVVEKLETELEIFLRSKKLDYKVLGLNTLIKEANFKYSGTYSLPTNYNSYVTLRSQLPLSLKDSFPVGDVYRLTLLGKPINVDQYKKDLKLIENFISKKSSNWMKFTAHGLYHNLMLAQRAMIDVLAKSFIITLLIISTVAMLFFRSYKLFLIFLVVNIAPVCISLFILYMLGLSLNIATVMTYSVGLGIIVDSSFHIIHALNHPKVNYEMYFRSIIKPVMVSSLIFLVSFSLFSTNDFLPIQQFGINLAILLWVGMIFDLFVLPTLFLRNNKVKNILNRRLPL